MKRGKKFCWTGYSAGLKAPLPRTGSPGLPRVTGPERSLCSLAGLKPGRYKGSKTKRKASAPKGGPELQGDWVRDAAKSDRCAGETPEVRGVEIDAQTRCVHWHSAVDIVAIKMRCCRVYWACKDCHVALAGHAIAVWGRGEWEERAVLCGACGVEMTIREYMDCESRCPGCGAGFNPGCRGHWHFYFEGEGEPKRA